MSFDIADFRKEMRNDYTKKENPATSNMMATQKKTTKQPNQVAETKKPSKAMTDHEKEKSPMSCALVLDTIKMMDAGLISLMGYIVFALYVKPQAQINTTLYLMLIVFTAPLAIMFLHTSKAYTMRSLSHIRNQITPLWVGWTLTFIVMVSLTISLNIYTEISRFWLLFFYMTGFLALMLSHITLAFFIKKWLKQGRMGKRIIIVGGGVAGQSLIESIKQSEDSNNITICGVFDDRDEKRLGTKIAGYPVLGTIQELTSFARTNRVDMLVVTLPLKAEYRLQQIFKTLWVLPIDIRLSAQSHILKLNAPSLSYLGKAPMIDVYNKPLSDWDVVLKNIFDKMIALAAFVLLSPVMILTALAVKLESKGPALFKQKRYGFNNELVEVYKFRSMFTDMSDANASTLVTKGDPRVTKVGRFIRKTSLDELPQLFNVLKGELSLVGPRPHAVQAKAADKLYQDVVDGYYARHKVKPGITGWAQINGWRGETDTDEKIQKRVDCDIHYIENWSILLDLYILIKTPWSLLNTKNAY